MNDVDEILTRIHAIVTAKDTKETNSGEKHALVLYYYALYQRSGQEHYLAQVRQNLIALIADTLRQYDDAQSVLSFPLIADLCRDNLVDDELRAALEQLDHYLFSRALALIKTSDSSFLTGALGIINYFAERLPDPRAEHFLGELLPAFYELQEKQYILLRNYRVISLRLPDGLVGILLVLIKCYGKGLVGERVKKIIREEILQIISYRLALDFTANRYSVFPDAVDRRGSHTSFDNTLSWSSGDLGKSLVLHRAAELFKDLDLDQMSNLVGLNTLLRKTTSTTNVTDACFSKGAAGLVETYKSLYRATRLEAYREGYHFWTGRAVELLKGELASGYYDGRELDVLSGLVGVALPLLSYRAEHRVKWSHCLLL